MLGLIFDEIGIPRCGVVQACRPPALAIGTSYTFIFVPMPNIDLVTVTFQVGILICTTCSP